MGIRSAKSGSRRFGRPTRRLAVSRRIEHSTMVNGGTGSVPSVELVGRHGGHPSKFLVGRHGGRPSIILETMASSSLWQRFQNYFLRYDDLDFSIDISRMKFPDDFFDRMRPRIDRAFTAMRDLEAGGIANPDEKRMVGHYWLRKPALAPNAELRADIEDTNTLIKKLDADV